MKTIGFVLAVLLTLTSAAFAQGPSYNFYSEVRDGYVIGQSVKLADAIIQNDFVTKWQNGVYVEVTLTTPLEAAGFASGSFGNEFDFVVGAPLKSFSLPLPGKVEVGTYQLAPLDRANHEFLTASWSITRGPVTTTIQRMEGIGSERFESGWFIKADLSKSVKLGTHFSVTLPLRLTWDSGVGGKDPGFIARVVPKLAVSLSEHASLYVGWEGHQPLSGQSGRNFESATRGGVSLSF